MTKFTRHDPRNKKRDRNKVRSLNKDIRIRLEDSRGNKTKDWVSYEDEDEEFQYEE
jgi:hypothetical protein